MIFQDRLEAGRLLAEKLQRYRGQSDTVVVALPRGGVVTGRAVADALELPLDIVVPRKLGAPENPEYAIGAIAESGQAVWNEREFARLDADYATGVVRRERAEAKRRLKKFRAGRPPRLLRNQTVIIVDDGVATGYTMRAALATVREAKPRRVVVAVPVAPPDTLATIAAEVEEVVCVLKASRLGAVGAHYRDFAQILDEEVIKLMAQRRGGE